MGENNIQINKTKKAIKSTIFYMFIVFVAFAFIIPLIYLTTTSFSSLIEVSDYPRQMFPSFSHNVEFSYDETYERYVLARENNKGEYVILNFGDEKNLSKYLEKNFNVFLEEDELLEIMLPAKETGEPIKVKLHKNIIANYIKFFETFDGVGEAFVNSIKAAIYTIILSLGIGGGLGYALAKTDIKGKQAIGVGALIVRMFPTIAISVSAAVMLIKFGMFDSMYGLAVIYAIPNIGLTAWITKGIFMNVNKELEEASLVFGATKIKTFYKITFPLVLPAFAASSMYAFITAWNDTAVALLLTTNNKTLSLVLYEAIGGVNSIHYAAAGSILLILPAAFFTFYLRKYINQLWG